MHVCVCWKFCSLFSLIKSGKHAVQVLSTFYLLSLSRRSLHYSHHSLSAAVQQDGNVAHVPHTLAAKAGSWIDRQM